MTRQERRVGDEDDLDADVDVPKALDDIAPAGR